MTYREAYAAARAALSDLSVAALDEGRAAVWVESQGALVALEEADEFDGLKLAQGGCDE